jgi:Na/Pi-cotransporter II-like protein
MHKEDKMDIFGILTLIGGLALFLYGMDVMGAGLEKVSGGKLERILEKLTSNPLKGVLLGAGVTAVIQSSSATTVMVVGFVNSGIMKLSQAIGIIMGANIGTTITSWLLSLTGIDSGNVWINLLKPSSFTPVLAMIGIVLMMTGKKSKKADVGEILLGFAVLMTGMESMSGAVKPLADVPEFTNILTMFHNPILGILVGALLTAVIQSSSASVGILQALSVTGAFTYGSVIPIILGQNIGTCVTAMISSVGANRNAKRTAFVHLYFNIIGTVLFLTLYSILNAVIHFPFANDTVGVAGIALIHSIFNIFATVVLFPFTKGLEKLAYLTLPITEEEKSKKEVQEFPLLDDRFLATPSFAIEQCHSMSIEMANLSKDSFLEAIGLLENYTQEVADDIITKENLVDKYEDKLRAYLTKLSSQNLTYADSQNVSTLLHCITDFERISDHAANIVDSIIEMTKKELVFSKKAEEEMHVFGKAVEDILCRTMTAYTADDEELAKTVEPLEQVIDELNKAIKKRHIKRLRKGKCSIELGLVLADIVTNYERVSDHCSNIAVCLIQEQDKEVEEHDLTAHMDEEDNRKFAEQIKEYTEKYALPEK